VLRNLLRTASKTRQLEWRTVTYYPRAAPGAEPASGGLTLYRAVREDSTRDSLSPGLGRRQASWTLFQSDLDNAGLEGDPQVGDVILDDDGVRWVCTREPEGLQGQEWQLDCLQEVT
jgi:hypothetical protein